MTLRLGFAILHDLRVDRQVGVVRDIGLRTPLPPGRRHPESGPFEAGRPWRVRAEGRRHLKGGQLIATSQLGAIVMGQLWAARSGCQWAAFALV
jgi:hypothetical protein